MQNSKGYNPYYHVFFKIKNRKEFFKELEGLIVSLTNHYHYLEEYRQIKAAKLYLMKKVNENNKIIKRLLNLLEKSLPLSLQDLVKLKANDIENVEELNEATSSKVKEKRELEKENETLEIKKEVKDLEALKKELLELEEKLARSVVENE